MSPGFNAFAPWLLDLFGGRQSARTLHFITASALIAFVVIHIVMVLVSGVLNNMRSMITGRYIHHRRAGRGVQAMSRLITRRRFLIGSTLTASALA